MEKLLKLENVSYSYQDGKEKNKILEHVSYSFEKGKIYAVVGASGTGKSYELNKEAKECFGEESRRFFIRRLLGSRKITSSTKYF